MTADPVQHAIHCALSGNWKQAIIANLAILEQDDKDVEALNRLARAYYETGKVKHAVQTAKRVLKLDPFNSIAKKSLDRFEKGPNSNSPKGAAPSVLSGFLEEPGKTKTVNLLHLGASSILTKLNSGDEAKLGVLGHRVTILTIPDNKLVGRLSDDLSARIKHLVKRGNSYKVFIKSVEFDADKKPQNVWVFIKEVKKVKELEDVPSFSSERIDYIAFTSPKVADREALTHLQED